MRFDANTSRDGHLRPTDEAGEEEILDDDEPTECECGDKLDSEGDCPACRAYQAEFRREWEATGRREYEIAQTYEQDMRDAGRGHLLR